MVENAGSIGARVAAAREAHGMTQHDLSGSTGIERSALAKIERGLRGVGALELASLAQALDVRMEWFLEDAPSALASHRTRAGVSVELSTIDREIERIARDVEFVGMLDPELLSATLDPVEVPNAAAVAESLAVTARTLCGLDAAQPVDDLAGILAGVGLFAFSAPLGPDTADAATTLLARGGVALVNSSHQVGRRRLALAHEFAHYLVADDYAIDWRVAEPSESDRTEVLFDRFARSFLAPAAALTSVWNQTRADHDLRTSAVLTASHFHIDMSTLARRLFELELASAGDCGSIRAVRTTKADIVEYGLRIAYDLDGVTLPRAYEKAVIALYRKERISAERTLALLRGTFEFDDLPALLPTHRDEIWSVVS